MHSLTKAPPAGRGILDEIIARVLGADADRTLRQRLLQILTQTYLAGGTTTAEALGIAPTVTADGAVIRRLITNHSPAIVGINDTTRVAIREALYDVVEQGGDLRDQVAAVKRVFQTASQSRAVAIARTESGIFWHAGGRTQGEEAGARSHTWLATRDPRVRDAHRAADGQCRPIDKPYDVGGEPLMHPCDPGGSPANIINCYLPGTLVSGRFVAGVRSTYAGPARHIVTRWGHRLAVTPNHPVLTDHGWVAARELQVGDYLLRDSGEAGPALVRALDDHEYEKPTRVEDVFESLRIGGSALRRQLTPDDLHGDARFIDGEVDVVRADRLLRHACDAAHPEFLLDLLLVEEPMRRPGLAGTRAEAALFVGDDASSRGAPGASGLALHTGTIGLHVAPLERLGVGSTANHLPRGLELAYQLRAGDPSLRGELIHRRAGAILFDEIVEVRNEEFRGHVYDLQSQSGLMLADNIVCSNCRCTETFGVSSCEGKAALSHAQGTAIWKRVMRALGAHERLAAVTMRRLFREQRSALLAELDRLAV